MKSVYLGFAYMVVIFGIILACFSVIGLMNLRFQAGFAMHQAMEKGVRMHESTDIVSKAMQTMLIENGITDADLTIHAHELYPNFLKSSVSINAFGYNVKMMRMMAEDTVQ